ncbi:MAG: sulfite exporter TauE/SafE family protein [Leptolyngbya sp. SIO4C1]|nr:sulfite exporter TauE/SafE family protein [Leptolyngbya sp. SIO4C1]
MLAMFPFLLLGAAIGSISGLIGIGGGALITPALVYLFGFSQHQAQGTTLALLVPPIGLLAAWTYYTEGYVDVRAAILICVGFVLGSVVGAKFAVDIPELLLKRMFGISLLVVSIRMIFSK